MTIDPAHDVYLAGFLVVNVLAVAFLLLSVMLGAFINIWSSVSDNDTFRYFFIFRAKIVTALSYYLYLLSLNIMMVALALYGIAKYPEPQDPINMPTVVVNHYPLTPDDITIEYNIL